MSESTQEEVHTGSIKTPKRLLPADTARAVRYGNGRRFMPGKP